MKKKIAVDESLGNVKDRLNDEGYEVVGAMDYEMADAIVVTGLDNNVMNMQETPSKAYLIDAGGKTAEEITAEIKERLKS